MTCAVLKLWGDTEKNRNNERSREIFISKVGGSGLGKMTRVGRRNPVFPTQYVFKCFSCEILLWLSDLKSPFYCFGMS